MTAYNAAETIQKAINSCLCQTYSNLEVIVVDDCSTDTTKDKVLSIQDDRIKYFHNDQNQGAGQSRRIGLTHITGDYTIFIDSDDWIEPTLFERLISTANEHNADIVSFGIRFIDGKQKYSQTYDELEVTTGKRGLSIKNPINKYLCNKLVKSNLWEKVEYSERRFVEDTQTCFYLYFFANIVVNIPFIGYNYLQNPKSLCHTASDLKKVVYSCLAAKDMCIFLKKHSTQQDYINGLKGFFHHVNGLKNIDLSEFPDEFEELNEFITTNLKHFK